MKNFKEFRDDSNLTEEQRHVLLEKGLARLHTHLTSGKPLGILSAKTGEMNNSDTKKATTNMISDLRGMGYGPIHSQGRSKWGPEASVIVPGISKEHLKKVGNKYKQQAVIHAKDINNASLHHLSTSETPGEEEKIGKAHFNTPNEFGVTILKGAGFSPKDERKPTRSFTFKEEDDPGFVLEALSWPPQGMLNPCWKPFI